MKVDQLREFFVIAEPDGELWENDYNDVLLVFNEKDAQELLDAVPSTEESEAKVVAFSCYVKRAS